MCHCKTTTRLSSMRCFLVLAQLHLGHASWHSHVKAVMREDSGAIGKISINVASTSQNWRGFQSQEGFAKTQRFQRTKARSLEDVIGCGSKMKQTQARSRVLKSLKRFTRRTKPQDVTTTSHRFYSLNMSWFWLVENHALALAYVNYCFAAISFLNCKQHTFQFGAWPTPDALKGWHGRVEFQQSESQISTSASPISSTCKTLVTLISGFLLVRTLSDVKGYSSTMSQQDANRYKS